MERKENSAFTAFKEQINDAINDLKTKGKRHRQIPNLLTLMRLTAPCFIIPAAAMGNVPLILGLTAIFSLTDLADGFIARNFHLTSELGETLDAVTDKVFASTLLIAASFSNPFLLCNLGLEGIIAGINTYKKLNDIPVKSSLVGKLKTWFLFSLVGVGIASPYFDLNSILNTLITTTTAMQLLTISSYLFPNFETNDLNKEEIVDINYTEVSNDSNIDDKRLQKEKILEVDTFIPKIQEEREDLKQLKAMREYLVSEQNFLEPEEDTTVISTNNSKSKKDDFKRN